MTKPIVFMFSGQGSQFFQMAKDLFDNVKIFREWMVDLDSIVYDINGISVLEYIYDKTKNIGNKCDNIRYTHPAIFMMEYSLAMVLLEEGIYPDLVLGSSLGEFTSLAVSGVLSVRDTLECILKHVECIETHCEKAGMMAILHPVELYENTKLIYKKSELAGINYNSHFIVSGKQENLDLIAYYLKERESLFQQLPVLYGFHSSLIEPAAKPYLEFLSTKRYKLPNIPIASCLYRKVVEEISSDYLWNVARRPIKFKQVIEHLEQCQSYTYIDLGPGSTLSNFTKRNLADNTKSESIPIVTMFNENLRNLEQLKKTLSK